MIDAIVEAVQREGGTTEDADDLIDVWERVQRRSEERADVIRREAREAQIKLGRQMIGVA